MLFQLLCGSALRIAEAALAAGPTILIGVLIASVMHRCLGQEGTRKLFGEGTWRALPQAWILGMLLPVCSLGVIPILRRMKQANLSAGVLLAFAVTGPLFNPLSLLYGLTLSQPLVVLTFAFASLIIVTCIGMVLDGIGGPNKTTAALQVNEDAVRVYGWPRVAATLLSAFRECSGASLGYIVLGLLGVGFLSMVMPANSMQMALEHHDLKAPLVTTGVSLLLYLTPLQAMWKLGSMFQHGNSVGAAFAMLVLGAGVNLGQVWWCFRNLQLRTSLVWLTLLVGTVLLFAYLFEGPLYPTDMDPAGHTHALDDVCHPFLDVVSHPAEQVAAKLRQNSQPHETQVWLVILAMFLVGFVIDRMDPEETWERKLQTLSPANTQYSSRDIILSPRLVGGLILMGLVVFSVAGCYVYYPPVKDCVGEMQIWRSEVFTAALSGDAKGVEMYAPTLDDWARRLEVGYFLRHGRISRFQQMKGFVFREKLELLQHAADHGTEQERRALVNECETAYRRLKIAFQGAP